jgi:hypothetical protein
VDRLARARTGDPAALEELRAELLGVARGAARRAGLADPDELAESALDDVLRAIAGGVFQGLAEQLPAYVRQAVANLAKSAWRDEVRCALAPEAYRRQVRGWADERRAWLERILADHAPEVPSREVSDRIIADLVGTTYAEFVRYYRVRTKATAEGARARKQLDLAEFGLQPSPHLVTAVNVVLRELRSDLERAFGARSVSFDDAPESGMPLTDRVTADGRESRQARAVEVAEARERFWRAYFRACEGPRADVDWLLALCRGLLELPSEHTATILGIEGETRGNVVDQRWKRAKERLGDWLAGDEEFRDATESLESGASDRAESVRP